MLEVVILWRKSNFFSQARTGQQLYTQAAFNQRGERLLLPNRFGTWKTRSRARPISQLVGTPAPPFPPACLPVAVHWTPAMDSLGDKADTCHRPGLTACTHAHTHSWNCCTAGVLLRGRERLSPGERTQHKPQEVSNVSS